MKSAGGSNPKLYGVNDGSSHLVKSVSGVERLATVSGCVPAGMNVLFVDGHLSWRNARDMQRYRFCKPSSSVDLTGGGSIKQELNRVLST